MSFDQCKSTETGTGAVDTSKCPINLCKANNTLTSGEKKSKTGKEI